MEQGTDKLLQKRPGNLPSGMTLHRAASEGDTNAIQMLIENGGSVNATDDDQYTALHEAASRGQTPAIQLLIDHGASVNAAGYLQMTPLHFAAFGGYIVAIQRLVENGASVNAQNENQMTPLHLAASFGRTAAISRLLLLGADQFTPDTSGCIPLHDGEFDVICLLLEHVCGFCECREQHSVDPSKINTPDPWGRTPLHLSKNIKPFTEFYELNEESLVGHLKAAVPCINVIDSEGTAEIDCVFGHLLKPVFQLWCDLTMYHIVQNGNKLSKIQTYMLRYLSPTVRKWEDHVFGSALHGDDYAVCSFPCNHVHNSQEMEEILRKIGDPEELYHQVMASSIGKCDMNCEESLSVMDEVEFFLNDLSTYFMQCSPLLQFQWQRVGSSAEGTKIQKPDEFDVLMEFIELSKYVMVEGGITIEWTGMSASVEQEMAQCFPHKEITYGFKVKIFQLITAFIAEKRSWGNLSFSCLRQFYCGFSVIFNMSNNTINLDIKVDLVPLLRDQQRLYVLRNIANSVGFVYESFAVRELEHMRSLPPTAREGYIMAKSLRDVHLLSQLIRRPIVSDVVDRVLPSHALKHALYHAAAEDNHLEETVRPHEWAKRIYKKMKKETMKNFFSHERLLSGRLDDSYPKQMYLSDFVERRRPGHKAFPAEMLESQYKDLFIDEIIKILN